jgi:hypothetical protein
MARILKKVFGKELKMRRNSLSTNPGFSVPAPNFSAGRALTLQPKAGRLCAVRSRHERFR